MANKGLEMLQIKKIIQLHCEGNGYREITNLLGTSRKTVTKYVLLFKSTGLSYADVKCLTEEELNTLMAKQEKPNENRLEMLQDMFSDIEKELIHGINDQSESTANLQDLDAQDENDN